MEAALSSRHAVCAIPGAVFGPVLTGAIRPFSNRTPELNWVAVLLGPTSDPVSAPTPVARDEGLEVPSGTREEERRLLAGDVGDGMLDGSARE